MMRTDIGVGSIHHKPVSSLIPLRSQKAVQTFWNSVELIEVAVALIQLFDVSDLMASVMRNGCWTVLLQKMHNRNDRYVGIWHNRVSNSLNHLIVLIAESDLDPIIVVRRNVIDVKNGNLAIYLACVSALMRMHPLNIVNGRALNRPM